MNSENDVVIAVAGSGKTTYLVNEALRVKDKNVLIVTYTESNEAEIRKKIFDINGFIPANVVVQTWFSFLIGHGVKPFQGGLFDFQVKGMQLVSSQSGLRFVNSNGQNVYWGETDFRRHYFDRADRVYSDKLSKLVVRCNERSDGNVIDRMSRIFGYIFIDEVQDLAGYDLKILIDLFKSFSRILLVGDPRQVTYLTHHEAKFKKYSNGGIVKFLKENVPKKVKYSVDENSLNASHRNSEEICNLSSKLFPDMTPSAACICEACREKSLPATGLFIVRPKDIRRYSELYQPVQLRDSIKTKGVVDGFKVMNFGASKGLGFDRVLIHPTKDMLGWILDSNVALKPLTKAKLYVAITRAKHSIAIVADLKNEQLPADFSLFT
ncbi:UvrD/REP helicase N-terminal domain-containing protein [Variovorax sp. OK605]|uniref:UvrD-helicase domain-containing protein n=1 Tax=Variovorax sp. OK605 TaxID=1855317 RepID=UPI0008E1DF59|nr:UvrD-helicase domain-containing protein [Variovorax sp. OK605]SFP56425.1 UvrD/REP helicase N-terminal domain-containing protein [Variovorax sp. OK605]